MSTEGRDEGMTTRRKKEKERGRGGYGKVGCRDGRTMARRMEG